MGRGATVNGGGTNPYNSFYEFKAFGYDKADKDAPNAPSFADPNITVVRDDDNTTYDSIGLTWTYDGEAEDAPKYYRVQRVMDGVVEFETDGEDQRQAMLIKAVHKDRSTVRMRLITVNRIMADIIYRI